MARLLHILAAPRPDGVSRTRKVVAAFFDTYRQTHPNDSIETLDLFAAALPEMDAVGVEAKFKNASGEPMESAVAERWRAIDGYVEQFLAADKYVFSSPMWNFGIPYRLKHYFDVIVQARRTFRFVGGKSEGLAAGRPAALLTSRGGIYAPGSPWEATNQQEPYLRTILAFIGLTELKVVAFEGTDSRGADQRLVAALEQARALAREF